MVHLFEWKWTDIANECETVLSKYGYGAVQISPPNEHLMQLQPDGNVPWWIRYQPVSYKLDKSRSGTAQEFVDMVNRCNKVGVRIIVDGVINHMVIINQKYPGTFGDGFWSSAGSTFDGSHLVDSFPAVPYSNTDFNDKRCDGDIHDGDYQNNAWAVRTCRLGGLLDLDQGTPWVRQKISEYFNHLIDLGVAGIRIDACKHMWPADLQAILGMVKDLNTTIYGPKVRPFVVQEVIDPGGQAVKETEYLQSGRITNFKYGLAVASAVRRQQNFKYFTNFGPGWAYLPDETSLVFIDNHDNQRDADTAVLYYQRDGWEYIMGVSYMLAWTYGYARVMSSYAFNTRDQGPPNTGSPNWTTISPTFQPDETCSKQGGWLCEHRLPQIRRMVAFRSVVSGEAAANIVADDHRIAFRRGSKGFYALNNQDSDWQKNFYVGMPEGSYCDVISGEYDEKSQKCTGLTVQVDSNGNANIKVYYKNMVAIHIGQRIPTTPIPTPSPLPASFKRTVVMVHKPTALGQNVFIRGGLNQDTHGCQGDSSASASKCAIPVVHRTNVSVDDFQAYLSWSQSDQYLDWFGGEANQGTYDGIVAQGTPLVWTTNQQGQLGYHPLNTYGSDYWLVDVMMDCSKTDNGWFSFKSFLKTGLNEGGVWENDIHQASTCRGDAASGTPSNIGTNHAGVCGEINVYDFGDNSCEIKHF